MTYAEIHIANKLDLLKDNISRQPVVFQWLQIVRLYLYICFCIRMRHVYIQAHLIMTLLSFNVIFAY